MTTAEIQQIGIRQGYKSPKLTNWQYKLATSASTAKMLFVGDSTSDLAGNAVALTALVTRYINNGDALAGFQTANMPNFGANGNTIQNFYNNLPSGKALNDVIAAAPDLIIFSYGINDVRQNQLTKAQLKTYLINIVNAFKAALPNTDIVLRMPNSFQNVTPNGYIQQGSYADIATAAQAQTDILYFAYKELEGYWDNVVAFDSQLEVWGRTCRTSPQWMNDEIHPNYTWMMQSLMRIIGYKEPFSEKRAVAALYNPTGGAASTYATPWTIYPRVLEYKKNFIKIAEGRLNALTAGSLMDIEITPYYIGIKDAYDAAAAVQRGDIVNIGDTTFWVVAASVSATSAGVMRISGANVPSSSMPVNTPVTIYRSVYNHTFATERYMDDVKTYPYRRRVFIASGTNGFLEIDITSYDKADALTKYDNIAGKFLQLTTTDVLIVNGLSALTLTSATFSPNGNNLRITIAGDYTSYANLTAYIFGTHTYENSFDATNTATGTTGNQTINNHSGTVNIAAAGTSVTVTNSMVKSGSLVQAWVRTNDSNKPIVANVVSTTGSFTINLSTAPAAEISIGFIVYN